MHFIYRRRCGPSAGAREQAAALGALIAKKSRAAVGGLAAGAAGAPAGVAVSIAVPVHHKLAAFALEVPAATGAVLAFGVVAYLLDDGDLRAVLASVRQVVRRA